jgi:hypothetical protein
MIGQYEEVNFPNEPELTYHESVDFLTKNFIPFMEITDPLGELVYSLIVEQMATT